LQEEIGCAKPKGAEALASLIAQALLEEE